MTKVNLQLNQHRFTVRNKNNALCTSESQPVMNGDITSEARMKSDDTDVRDATDIISSKTVIGCKPSAERCRLNESGDQLQTNNEVPLSATSPVSENGGDVGMFDIYIHILCNLATILA